VVGAGTEVQSEVHRCIVGAGAEDQRCRCIGAA